MSKNVKADIARNRITEVFIDYCNPIRTRRNEARFESGYKLRDSTVEWLIANLSEAERMKILVNAVGEDGIFKYCMYPKELFALREIWRKENHIHYQEVCDEYNNKSAVARCYANVAMEDAVLNDYQDIPKVIKDFKNALRTITGDEEVRDLGRFSEDCRIFV